MTDRLGRLGSAGNFLALLQLSQASAVLFADQDDIWMSIKVSRSLKALYEAEAVHPGTPLLIVSDAVSFEDGVGLVGASTQRARPERLEDFLFLNGGLYGCCMILNRDLVRVLVERPTDFCAQHDHLVSLAALSVGHVIYVRERLLFYRRHSRNVSGGPVSLATKLRNYVFGRTPLLSAAHVLGVESFLRAYADDLTPARRSVVERFIGLSKASRPAIAWAVVVSGYRLYGSRLLILAKLLLRPVS